jgi:fructosamine-3-kinase
MILQNNLSEIAQQIREVTNTSFEIQTTKPIAGGDINRAFLLQGDKERYFVKLNRTDLVEMFAAEFVALNELAQTKTIKVPTPSYITIRTFVRATTRATASNQTAFFRMANG